MSRDDRSGELIGVLIFFTCICTILVALRCYCRAVIVKSFAADDCCSVLTLFAFIAFCTLGILAAKNGAGKKLHLIAGKDLPNAMKWWWACESSYAVCNIFLKLSIVIFLLWIAVQTTHRILLWISIIVIQVYNVFFMPLFIFQCTPISYFWGIWTGTKGHCIPSNVIIGSFYGFSVINCIADWQFCVIPIFIVCKLQLSRREKIIVVILLGCCAIGSTATIIRIPYVKTLNNKVEFLYATIDLAIWTVCEAGIALSASSAATLRPLFRQVFGNSHRSSSRMVSRSYDGINPSTSGYTVDSNPNNDHDMPLEERVPKIPRAKLRNQDASKRSKSKARLEDWEHENLKDLNNHYNPVTASDGNIVKSVAISQV